MKFMICRGGTHQDRSRCRDMSTDIQQTLHKAGSDGGPSENVTVQSTSDLSPQLPPTFWTGDVLWGSVGWSSWGSSVAEIFESVPSCFLQSDKCRRTLVREGCSAWDQARAHQKEAPREMLLVSFSHRIEIRVVHFNHFSAREKCIFHQLPSKNGGAQNSANMLQFEL